MPVNASVTSKRSHHAGAHSTVSRSKFGGAGSVHASRTALSSSRSGRNVAEAHTTYKPPVSVIDQETGKDVTPQPLLFLNPAQVRKNQSNLLVDQGSQAGTPTDLQSQASIYQGTVNASTMFGGGPFTRSVFSASGAASDSDTISVSDEAAADGGSHHAVTAPAAAPKDLSTWGQIQKEEPKEDLTESDLEKEVTLVLTETSTIWLLDINGTCHSTEEPETKSIKERNEKYDELCKSRVGNDLYTERGMMTFNHPPKLKAVQTDKIGHNDIALMATNWDMYDTYELTQQLEEAANPNKQGDIQVAARPGSGQQDEGAAASAAKDVTSNMSHIKRSLHTTSTAMGTMISKIVEESNTVLGSSQSIPGGMMGHPSTEPSEEGEQQLQAKRNEQILKSDSFRNNLFMMERVINLNTYQEKLAHYRGFEPCISTQQEEVTPADGANPHPAATSALVEPSITQASQGPNLERLWCYLCPLTKGKNASCSAWNRTNPDLIAFGYGQFEFVNQKGGLVACWSLKNPDYPERVFHSEVGVTAMDFSSTNPNLLAVGLYDGTIAVYNVKVSESDPVLDTFENNHRHTAPIWQLKWIEKEKGKGDDPSQNQEVLISISADGRVCQWTIRKGFECADLIKLKRVQLKQHVGGKVKSEKKGDALISRLAGGYCFSFSEEDPIMYIAGTEEGYIHKCSCSYNEQYLDTFEGHGGPVYSLRWSPFCKNLFLSCSADWSIRLWRHDRLRPILTFISSTKSVNDVCWSPYCSTVFACVNDYAVEVWDLAQSTLDPLISVSSSGPKMTNITFASNSESILVGDSTGQVMVYQLKGMPAKLANQEEVLNKIVAASLATQLQEEESTPAEDQTENSGSQAEAT